MAPPRKILRRQLEILVDYLEENRDISRGTPFSPVGHQSAKVKWNALAKKLNTVEGGAHKSPEGWKKYWFEWRHRCRKKAANVRQSQSNSANGSHKVSLNDVEVRALNINSKDIVDHVDSGPKKLQIFLSEDSDSEQPTKDIEQITSEDVKETTGSRKFITESTLRNSTPPPEWAIMLEDRRIAAEERIAKSLETIVTLMQLQEDRRAIIEEKIADTLVAITSNLKELHSENRKHLHCCKSNNEETESLPMKDVIFL